MTVAVPTVSTPCVSVGTRRQRVVGFLRESGPHGAWIAIWSVIGLSGTGGAPLLLDHPFLLMMLAPRTAFVFLAAPTVGLVWFVVLGTLRLSITDASWFLVGRRVPGRTAAKIDQHRRRPWMQASIRWTRVLVEWLSRSRLLAGLVLFMRPNGRYLGLAGALGVCPRIAASTSVLGTIAYLVAVHVGVGELLR